MQRWLVSPAARRAFRESASGWGGLPVRIIEDIWRDEGFAPNWDGVAEGEAARRGTYQAYLEAVDWTDHGSVVRALRAFEATLRAVKPTPYTEDDAFFVECRDRLERDGYVLDERGRIRWGTPRSLTPGALSNLSDATAITAALDRISGCVDTDPALAIGTSKELIESTAKVVLAECRVPWSDREDVPALIRRAQEALLLHPGKAPRGPDGADALRKVLGGLTAIAIGVVELRNRGYGSGHGGVSAPAGLGPRHARLCVSAATTWCQTMLETLADPRAPWRAASEKQESAGT